MYSAVLLSCTPHRLNTRDCKGPVVFAREQQRLNRSAQRAGYFADVAESIEKGNGLLMEIYGLRIFALRVYWLWRVAFASDSLPSSCLAMASAAPARRRALRHRPTPALTLSAISEIISGRTSVRWWARNFWRPPSSARPVSCFSRCSRLFVRRASVT